MTTNRSVLRKLVTVSAISGTMLLGVPSPAQASTSCAANHVCMWEDSNYGGDRWVDEAYTEPSDGAVDIDAWDGDNEISSIKNTTDFYLCVFANDEGYARHVVVEPHTNVPDLGQAYGFDNDAESYRVVENSFTC